MKKRLKKDLVVRLCLFCQQETVGPCSFRTEGDICSWKGEQAELIHQIYLKHGYGQKDENVAFPHALTKVFPTIAQNMKDEGWHKDKLQVKLTHTETGKVSQDYLTPDASERRM